MSRVQPPGRAPRTTRPVAGLIPALAQPVRESERVRDRRAGDVGRRDVVVDRERAVREAARERPSRPSCCRSSSAEPTGWPPTSPARSRVVLVEALVRREAARAGLAQLDRVRGVGVSETADTLPAAVQIVEAVVLLVDHDDVPDRPQLVRVGVRVGGRAARHDESDGTPRLQPRRAPKSAEACKTSSVEFLPSVDFCAPARGPSHPGAAPVKCISFYRSGYAGGRSARGRLGSRTTAGT